MNSKQDKFRRKQPRVVLLFSRGSSIQGWKKSGTLERDLLLYRRLKQNGISTDLMTYGLTKTENTFVSDFSIYGKSRPKGNNRYGFMLSIHHYKALSTCSVLKTHQIEGSIFAVLAKWIFRKPLIVRCGYLPSVFRKKNGESLQRRLLANIEEWVAFVFADQICIPSKMEADHIIAKYKIRRSKVSVMPNWVDCDVFRPMPEIEKIPGRVCFVARFEDQKQPLEVIEALRDSTDVELVFIGGGSLAEEIRDKAREYNLSCSVLDRVNNEQLPKELCQSMVYVLPTKYEGGSPKTLLEAMACGVPVVSTNAFGVDSVFKNRIHGVKVGPHDIEAFGSSIKSLLADKTKRDTYGRNGRDHVKANYSINSAVQREVALIKMLVNKDA